MSSLKITEMESICTARSFMIRSVEDSRNNRTRKTAPIHNSIFSLLGMFLLLSHCFFISNCRKMDPHSSSLIWLRLYRKPVVFAKIQMNPFIYVLYADPGTSSGRNMTGICKQTLYLFLRHAKPIVLHTQVKILFLFPCPYFDLTVTIHKLHAMINGVFHHRLQNQL